MTRDLQDVARHSIGVVVRRTGLKPDRLRAWERRYGVVEPDRSPGNQRLYSDADIERLSLLRQAVDEGHRIANIADLGTADLRELVASAIMARRPPAPGAPLSAEARRRAGTFLDNCLAATQRLDAEALDAELMRAAEDLEPRALMQELLVPFLHRIGDLWGEGGLKAAHEHLASAVVRVFVGKLHDAYTADVDAPSFVVTTPAGQRHELGALLAAETAAADGWSVTYLGPDLPAEEIALAARQRAARAVGLSVVYPEEDAELPDELQKLRRHLGDDILIIVGGRAAGAYEEPLAAIGAHRVGDLEELRGALASVAGVPAPPSGSVDA